MTDLAKRVQDLAKRIDDHCRRVESFIDKAANIEGDLHVNRYLTRRGRKPRRRKPLSGLPRTGRMY